MSNTGESVIGDIITFYKTLEKIKYDPRLKINDELAYLMLSNNFVETKIIKVDDMLDEQIIKMRKIYNLSIKEIYESAYFLSFKGLWALHVYKEKKFISDEVKLLFR